MSGAELVEIALVAAAALVCGLLLQRLRQPVVVGYIAAGVLLGPSALGLIEERETVNIMAELGVLMLLFIIGMELSLRGFRRVIKVSLICAMSQIVIGTGIMLLVGKLLGWPYEMAVLFGFVVALSSTAVAIKILEDIGEIRTDVGRTAIGVLIAQDLAVVPMLLIIKGIAGEGGNILFSVAAKVILAVGLLIFLIYYLTRRERVRTPFTDRTWDNPELAAVTAMAYCFTAALLTHAVGLSAAYGAFLAGLWIGNSTARAPILQAAIPIQGVLLMVLFLSFGLLLDLQYIWQNIWTVLLLLLLVTVVKTTLNIGFLRLAGVAWPQAWLAGMTIGQIGEFSFVLVAAGTTAGLLSPEDHRLAISVIALSLMTSPFWLYTARRMEGLALRRIVTLRQLLRSVYGREARAVVVAGRQTVNFSIRVGEQGKDLFQQMRAEESPSDDEGEGRDAEFPDGPPGDSKPRRDAAE